MADPDDRHHMRQVIGEVIGNAEKGRRGSRLLLEPLAVSAKAKDVVRKLAKATAQFRSNKPDPRGKPLNFIYSHYLLPESPDFQRSTIARSHSEVYLGEVSAFDRIAWIRFSRGQYEPVRSSCMRVSAPVRYDSSAHSGEAQGQVHQQHRYHRTALKLSQARFSHCHPPCRMRLERSCLNTSTYFCSAGQ